MRDRLGCELDDELGAEGLVPDGRVEELEPTAEALHLGREGVRGVVPEEHGLVLDQSPPAPPPRPPCAPPTTADSIERNRTSHAHLNSSFSTTRKATNKFFGDK